jgi:tetratricopeptide (TPR) repeat protein
MLRASSCCRSRRPSRSCPGFEAARAAFERAIATNPGNCSAHSEYGVMLRKLGEFNAALTQYQACLAASPDHAETYYNLGILYELYLGRLDDALDAYREYQKLRPEPDKKVQGWIADLERRQKS